MGRYASPYLREDDLVPRRTIGKHELPRERGRRRAEVELAPENELIDSGNPANPGPLHRKGAHRGKRSLRPTIGTALGVATTGAIMVAANATVTEPQVIVGQPVFSEEPEPITADSTVVVTPPRVDVTTEAAPPPPPPPVVEPPTELVPVVEQAVPKVEYTPAPPTPTVIVPPAPVVAPGAATRQQILNAAYAQIGVWQDCTMLVTNSLRSVGIYHHGWPISYFNLGYQVARSDALPGDLVYYQHGSWSGSLAHIAVYAGNGRAVHGGFNGNQTVEYSVDVGSGPVFIRVT